jgi:hypothetical protein
MVESLIGLAPLVFSIGIFYSIVFLSFTRPYCEWKERRCNDAVATGSSLSLTLHPSIVNPIQQWIVRVIRRKVGIDEDTDGLTLIDLTIYNQEDNHEKNNETRSYAVDGGYPGHFTKRLLNNINYTTD